MPSAVVVALVVGSAIAVQVAIVGRASRTLHPLVISLALQVAGLLIGLGWLLWPRSWPQLPQVIGQWWWLPLGVVGWVVVAALVLRPRVGGWGWVPRRARAVCRHGPRCVAVDRRHGPGAAVGPAVGSLRRRPTAYRNAKARLGFDAHLPHWASPGAGEA